MVKEIIITNKDKVVTKVLVDDEDHLWLSKYTWYIKKPDKNAKGGCISTKYKENGRDVHGTMHIMIMKEKTKDIPPKDYVITHKDKNYLNNTRENLEYNSRSASNQGKNKKEGTTFDYKGVSFYKDRRRFIAKQGQDNLGSYATQEEAAKVYDLYVLKKYGKDIETNGFVTWNDLSEELKKEITENIMKTKVLTKLDKLNLLSEEIQEKLTHAAKNKKITYNSENQAIIKTHKKQEIIVDADKWHELSVKKWRINDGGYAITDTKNSPIAMQNYLMNNSDDEIVVDHINKNKQDNRMENLRFATNSQNSHNRKKSENATSKYNGVTKNNNSYLVSIKKDGARYNLGSYSDEKLAALAYNIKASELYGNHANLNKLPEDFVAANIDELTKKINTAKDITSQYTGISFRTDTNNWRFRFTYCKKKYERSGFKTEKEAVEAYNISVNNLLSELEVIPENMNKIRQLKEKFITI
jgi:hypothetical protein